MASPSVHNDPAVPSAVSSGTVDRLRKDRAAEHPGRLHRWRSALLGVGGLRILAALAGGLALYAAFAPSTQWWFALVGFALLGLSLAGASVAGGFGFGVVFGLAFYLPC